MSAPLSAPLSLRELAAALGWSTRVSSLRKLRRLIRRRERALGVTLYHCAGPRSAGYVTLRELRSNMPELFPPVVDEAAELARAAVRDLRERLATMEARLDAVARLAASKSG